MSVIDARRSRPFNYVMAAHEKISQLMDARRVSQAELAEAAGMVQSSISKLLRGERRLYADQAYQIARYLETSVEYLFDDTLDSPQPSDMGLSKDEEFLLAVIRRIGIEQAEARLLGRPQIVLNPEPGTPAQHVYVKRPGEQG